MVNVGAVVYAKLSIRVNLAMLPEVLLQINRNFIAVGRVHMIGIFSVNSCLK